MTGQRSHALSIRTCSRSGEMSIRPSPPGRTTLGPILLTISEAASNRSFTKYMFGLPDGVVTPAVALTFFSASAPRNCVMNGRWRGGRNRRKRRRPARSRRLVPGGEINALVVHRHDGALGWPAPGDPHRGPPCCEPPEGCVRERARAYPPRPGLRYQQLTEPASPALGHGKTQLALNDETVDHCRRAALLHRRSSPA